MSYKQMPLDGFHNTTHKALVALQDEYGQKMRIVMDDGCYVLQTFIEKNSDAKWKSVTHWFPEAATALTNIVVANLFIQQVRNATKQPPNTTVEGPWSPAPFQD